MAKMPEARCTNFQLHAAHKWSDDRGLNYRWCKGLDATTAALIRALPHLEEGNVAGTSSEVEIAETWAYHVDTHTHESRVIKKYGNSSSGMIIAAYKDRGDAQLVASLLNRLRDGEVDN